MMKILMTAGLALGVCFMAGAQCNEFMIVKEGTTMVQETYDKKDKLQGVTKSIYKDYKSTADGFTAKVQIVNYDDKDRSLGNVTADVRCANGTFYMDMESFLNPEQLAAFKDMDIKIDAEELQVPGSLAVGQTLPDAKINITVSGTPIPMNMETTIKDRKVAGKEMRSTPMGQVACYKITYRTETKSVMSVTFENVDYWAPGYGPVRSETYRNGKLMGYTKLVSYN